MDQMEMSVSRGIRRSQLRPRRRRIAALSAAVVLGACLWPLPAAAGSNLAQGYPEHQCGERPEPPERPEKFRDRAELDAYNEQVTAFNAEMEQFIGCLQSYVDDAAADISDIREKVKAALEEAEQ